MIDKRLLDNQFNPSVMLDGWISLSVGGHVTLFDRAMLAAMSGVDHEELNWGTVGNPHDPWPSVAASCANAAIAFLEKRASCLGIEVTP